MTIYWIDAGVLIMAANRHYGFQLVPKFWVWIQGEIEKGSIRMPSLAFQEVIDGNDELAKWCRTRKNMGHFCVKPEKQVQVRYSTIADHVYRSYKAHQATEFLKGADGWLIAHALETQGIVITEENTAHNKSKVKIPTVCKALQTPWKNTFDMCKELGAKF